MPTILHIDMDAFFASAEAVRNPNLRKKPLIVGGQPHTRGVVSTCSYEARRFGVRSAMSLAEAYRRCPQAIFLDGDFALYRDYSAQVMEIFRSFTPLVEVMSIDEAYLDVTGLAGDPIALGHQIRATVFKKTGLTCSVGIGTSKLIAKMGSSSNKPDGLRYVASGEEEAFLTPLAVEAIPGIGPKTKELLNSASIRTVEDLQAIPMESLLHTYGAFGYQLFLLAHGIDNRPVETEEGAPKSIGAETTFERDVNEREPLMRALEELVEKSWNRLKRHKMRTRGIALKLRFSDFQTITRSTILFTHTNARDEIFRALVKLFDKHYRGTPPLRLVGLRLEKLTDSYWQPTFWDSRGIQ